MAKVPKTSGQGVSRKAYMSAWRAAHPGGGGAGVSNAPAALKAETPVSGRSYGKAGFQPPPGAMHIDYEPTPFQNVSTLKEVKKIGAEKTPKTPDIFKVAAPKRGKGL